MKHNDIKNRNERKNITKSRTTILFIIITIFVIIGSATIAQRLSANKQAVQAAVNNPTESQDTNSSQESNDNSINKESDSSVENVEYLEKYIEQQIKNQKPDGADGKYVDTDDASKNLVKREISEGNAIGIHSYSHDYNYLFPKGKINLENCMSDFEKTDTALKNVLGQDFSTRAIRFPGGQETWSKKDPQGAEAVDKALHEKDWHQIDWNCLSGDAESGHKDAAQLTQEAIKTIGNREKALILMHDTYGKEETAKALPGIIEYLKKQGYEFKIIK